MADNKTNGTSRLNSTATDDGEKRPPAGSAAADAAAEALAMAEEAEAEAAEAEALAAAARARARAIRLRRQARSGASEASAESDEAQPDGAEVETAAATPTEVPRPTHGQAPETAEGDEAETGEGTDVEPPVDEAPRPPRRWLRRGVWAKVALGLTFLLICVLLAASGAMMWQHRQAAAARQRSAEFAAAARQGVVTLMSLDFNHAKNDVQRVIDNTTGQFHDDFQSRADDFTKVMQESKVVTTSSATATAVQSMSGNSAVVLVSATSQVSNATGAQNEPRVWRLMVTVQKDGGQIKMSRVEFVP